MSQLAEDVDFKVGLGAVRDLLERNGINPAEVGRLHRIKDVKLYQGQAKIEGTDEDGNPKQHVEVHDMVSVMLSPKWDDGPEWPVIDRGPAQKLPAAPASAKKLTDEQLVVILPDIQAGYFRAADGSLEAIHDLQAIEVALQVIKDAKPDRIVLLGDNADFADLGRYRTTPAFQQTTQETIDWLTQFTARLRHLAPNAQIDWLAGNHEERLPYFILDNAKAAFGLRQGRSEDRPANWPVLTIPHLCRLDEVGVTYHPGYPASDIWLTSNLRIIHGNRVKSKGSTAHVYLNESKTSVIYGHIHRIERAHQTREDFEGVSEIMAASPGCLARIDGVVPSTGQGTDLDGRPLPKVENWQQGLAVVTIRDNGKWDYEQIRIDPEDHTAVWRGKLYG